MLDRSEVGRRGYLNEDYRLFHLRDSQALAPGYHYHEFDKLVLQLGGRVTYNIEGKSYPLQPMDVHDPPAGDRAGSGLRADGAVD